jgi:hypothetical protein
MLASIIGKFLPYLPSWVGTAWPYVTFYFANRKLIRQWFDLSKDIIAKYKREHPGAKAPTPKEVVVALGESSAGRTSFTPKKVRDWTPQEWKNFETSIQGSGTGQF